MTNIDRKCDGLKQAIDKAIAEHHKAGYAVPTWHDGRVMWRHPDGSLRDENNQQTSDEVRKTWLVQIDLLALWRWLTQRRK